MLRFRSNMKNNQKLILGSLAVIAIVLGFLVYKKMNPQTGSKPSSKQSSQTKQTKTVESTLTEDEKKLLAVPASNAKTDEIKQHSELAAKLAVLGSEIEVGDCKAKPLVLQLKQEATFNLKNSGTSKVSITFDNNHVNYVDAGKSTPVKASLDHGPGLYGYRCTTSNDNAISGFVLVTP